MPASGWSPSGVPRKACSRASAALFPRRSSFLSSTSASSGATCVFVRGPRQSPARCPHARGRSYVHGLKAGCDVHAMGARFHASRASRSARASPMRAEKLPVMGASEAVEPSPESSRRPRPRAADALCADADDLFGRGIMPLGGNITVQAEVTLRKSPPGDPALPSTSRAQPCTTRVLHGAVAVRSRCPRSDRSTRGSRAIF